MATFITVEQKAAQSLLIQNRQQTLRNREQLAVEEARNLQPSTNQATAEPIVGQRRQLSPLDELSASRRNQMQAYGFIDVNNANTTYPPDPAFVPDLYFSETYRINLNQSIRGRYAAVRVAVGLPGDACIGRQAAPGPLFAGKETELAELVTTGGVVWINSEFKDCGIDSAVFSAYVNTVFGTTMTFNDDQIDGVNGQELIIDGRMVGFRNALLYSTMSGRVPPYFYTDASCSISGGTPFYGGSGYSVCSFERIGRGYLVLSGDSNGTAFLPSVTEGTVNFIDALRVLRRL